MRARLPAAPCAGHGSTGGDDAAGAGEGVPCAGEGPEQQQGAAEHGAGGAPHSIGWQPPGSAQRLQSAAQRGGGGDAEAEPHGDAQMTGEDDGQAAAVGAHQRSSDGACDGGGGGGAGDQRRQHHASSPVLASPLARLPAPGPSPLLGLVGYDGHPVDAVVGVRRVRGPGDTPLGARALQQSGGGSVDGHGGGPQHFASPAVMMMMAVDSPSKRLDMLAGGWRARAHAKRGDRRFVHRRDGVATLAAALQ